MKAPRDSCLLEVMSLCSPLPQWIGLSCMDIAERRVWHQRLGNKRYHGFFLTLFASLIHSKGRELPYSEDTQTARWKDEASCQQLKSIGHSCKSATLESDPPALVSSAEIHGSSFHLACNFMRDLKPELLIWVTYEFLTHRTWVR